jgi:sterol desaturase/sphingolipid hydroxylase (fatty acid hydroxylase superfamily)
MMIHPMEGFGYYLILYAPPFLFRLPLLSFFLYMAVMGLCGVLDHSGVRFSVPYVYNTQDHDNHHRLFNYNYAFPFPYMDYLHGTHAASVTHVHMGKMDTLVYNKQQERLKKESSRRSSKKKSTSTKQRGSSKKKKKKRDRDIVVSRK